MVRERDAEGSVSGGFRVQGGRMDENTSVETRTERKREKDGKKQGSGKGKERGLEDVRK